MRKLVLVAAAALTMAACSKATPDAPTTTTSVTSTSTTVVAATPPFGTTSIQTADSPTPAALTAVTLATHDGFERIVFTFDNVPGYRVSAAVGPFAADGSGAAVAVSGNRGLVVRMTASDRDPNGSTTYTGPTRLPGAAPVTEVVQAGDFEGVLTWVVGLANDHAFRAFALSNPARVVVDVQS